jgi:mRNA interferase HigB
VNIIARKALREFWEKHAQAETPMKLLYSRLESRDWEGPQDIKDEFGTSVDFVGDNRVIFDVSGNKYRVIIAFAYEYKRGLIKFVGTHSEYDKINAETI